MRAEGAAYALADGSCLGSNVLPRLLARRETLRDVQLVTVSVSLSPGLQTSFSHEVQLYVDGAPFGQPGEATQFVLEDVERGAHELQAAVFNRSGRELKRSSASVFFLHKHSIVNPAQAR